MKSFYYFARPLFVLCLGAWLLLGCQPAPVEVVVNVPPAATAEPISPTTVADVVQPEPTTDSEPTEPASEPTTEPLVEPTAEPTAEPTTELVIVIQPTATATTGVVIDQVAPLPTATQPLQVAPQPTATQPLQVAPQPTATTPLVIAVPNVPAFMSQPTYAGNCTERPPNTICLGFSDGYVWLVDDTLLAWDTGEPYQGNQVQIAEGAKGFYHHVLTTDLVKFVPKN